MMRRLLTPGLFGMAILLVTALAAVAQDGSSAVTAAIATLKDIDGKQIGVVTFTTQKDGVLITADVKGLTPGFLGFHVHTVGNCTDTGNGPFSGAGGHLNPDNAAHPNHDGDLPSLLINSDGTGFLSVKTDRFTIADLLDGDGSAVMIHSGPDNFANIPERYGGVDDESKMHGDSGTRIVCGVVEPAGSGTFASQPTMESTGEATAEMTMEVPAEMTMEATAEATAEATMEMTPVATAEVTLEATAEVTAEVTPMN